MNHSFDRVQISFILHGACKVVDMLIVQLLSHWCNAFILGSQ